MRNKSVTADYYIHQLGFSMVGSGDFEGYLMIKKDNIEIHFFEHKALLPEENHGQVYIRCKNIDGVHQALLDKKVNIHPNGNLGTRPWGQREFSLLDPDNNLLTFGETH